MQRSIPDLAVSFQGGARVLLGNGDGTFQANPLSYVTGLFPQAVAAADVNGDGLADLVVTNINANNITLLFNDGVWAAPRRRPSIKPSSTASRRSSHFLARVPRTSESALLAEAVANHSATPVGNRQGARS